MPYLDKIVTEKHTPRIDGQLGFVAKEDFPDLGHTGLRSNFEPKAIPISKKNGAIGPVFKDMAYTSMRNLERDVIKANNLENTFARGHKQFIDAVLCEMETEKRDKLKRHDEEWSETKKRLGFSNLGNSFERTDSTLNEDTMMQNSIGGKKSIKKSKSYMSDSNRVRVFNRMTQFQHLLDTTPVPTNVKRFGTL